MLENYSAAARKVLGGAGVGDKLTLEKAGTIYEGVLMPRINAGDRDCIVLKLKNGYNLGIKAEKGVKVLKSEKAKPKEKAKEIILPFDAKKPTIAIIGTGGTIASRVDYQTGGVVPVNSAGDLVNSIPELKGMANLRCRVLFEMFSEDMNFSHYSDIAKAVADEIRKGCDGVIITHGTDTMHYTAAALSFALRELPVPVVLVGSQRSADRGSSDAAMNMICAANFIIKSDWSGVGICMHGTLSDDYCLIHEGTRVRKMHSSRRDAFQSVNATPIAKVLLDGSVEMLRKEYAKKDKARKPKVIEKFERKVGLLKIYPGIDPAIFRAFSKFRGVVLEGTGLGHASITETDKYTAQNRKIFEELKKLAKKSVVVMSSQCISGRVNMSVYSTGRRLQEIGVVSGEDMTPEVALVKLAWLLANEPKKARELVGQNLAGEISNRGEVTF
ncbi:MAG: Glu-tRNA(Gln) amidotransferase subunit GatD [Candidatus Aenigmatarchaeota archaeon]